MKRAWLKIVSPDNTTEEIELLGEVTIGRAKDNTIIIDQASTALYQAILEKKQQSYYLTDLGGVNGILLNGTRIYKETSLKDNDEIKIGLCKLIFHQIDQQKNLPKQIISPSPTSTTPTNTIDNKALSVAENSASKKTPSLMIISALSLGLIVISTIILFLMNDRQTEKANEQIHIISPTSGTTVREPINILVEVKNSAKIDNVIYQLDGVEIAKRETPPYNTTIDPQKLTAKFPNLTLSNHILSITIEDLKGKKVLQSDTLLLAFENALEQTATNTPTPEPVNNTNNSSPLPTTLDINALATNLVAQIAQKSGYQFRPQFIEKIRLRTSAQHIDTFNEVRHNRREIIKAFRDKGLHPLLGFILVISESHFQAVTTGANNKVKMGLWQIPPEIGRNYLLPGESETALNDPKRGAEIAATYLKDLINVFGVDNFIYAIACYGQSLNQAGELRTKLESSTLTTTWQNDFWRTVEAGLITTAGADQVIDFFAAGIVGENPQAFSIPEERLSSFY